MPSAVQLKALLKSHLDGNDEQFVTVALQVAAHEARRGHGKLAEEIRALIDAASVQHRATSPVPINRPSGDVTNLLDVSFPKTRLAEMILEEALSKQVRRVIREQKHSDRLETYGLTPRRKLLLVGPPGTGKTLTASVLAGELGLPLMQVRLDCLITKFMGETAAKLRQIFEATHRSWGVYFFDEFDAIGSHRGLSNDVGEIRRVLNSFLQMIEEDHSQSLVVAATNHPDILDRALFRRFDDVLHYQLPDRGQIVKLLQMRLAGIAIQKIQWQDLARWALGLSYAEVTRAANEALKDALMGGREKVYEEDIRAMLAERKAIGERLAEKSL